MFKYKGIECPYCHKEFQESDRILICPDCGAPYHAECIKESGSCVLTELHEKGEHWQPPNRPREEDKFDSMAERRCTRCGTVNAPEMLFCEVCGNDLNQKDPNENPRPREGATPPPPTGNFQQINFSDPYTTPFGGLGPDEEIDGLPVKDLALYVRENTPYFLPKFKEFKTTKRITSWNWAAFFLDFYYFLYRKMWGMAAIVLIITSLLSLPSLALTFETLVLTVTEGESSMIESLGIGTDKFVLLANFFSFLSLGFKVFLAVTVNKLYAGKAFKDVHKLKKEQGGNPDYSTKLSAKGGTSKMAVLIALIATIVISVIFTGITTSVLMSSFY